MSSIPSPVLSAPQREWRDVVRSPSGQWIAWGALVIGCMASRLATTITYIEDPDSLRFALSVADSYDVAALQPHFPGSFQGPPSFGPR